MGVAVGFADGRARKIEFESSSRQVMSLSEKLIMEKYSGWLFLGHQIQLSRYGHVLTLYKALEYILYIIRDYIFIYIIALRRERKASWLL